jgi:hypothetical protein
VIVAAWWAVLLALAIPHKHRGPLEHVEASSTCYAQGDTTASGRRAFLGEVAQNTLPLGTWIELDRPVFGRRRFQVLDRIGWGSELDIYNPSEGACIRYGRQQVGYLVLGP